MEDKSSSTFGRYFRVWKRSVVINFSIIAASRIDFFTFVFAKLVRMGFFLVLALTLFSTTQTIKGYGKGEVLVFFAVMNFIDVFVQLFWYRGFTDLQRLVRNGDFDLVLTKPLSPLFWSAFRIFDFFDLTTIPAAILFLWYAFSQLPVFPSGENIFLGIVVLLVGFLLAFAVNLMLASLTFFTTELENAWWIYRDIVYVSRFPPEVFPRVARCVFTFIFPVIVIVIFPAKALLGLLTLPMIIWTFATSLLFLFLALKIWHAALRHYSSASA